MRLALGVFLSMAAGGCAAGDAPASSRALDDSVSNGQADTSIATDATAAEVVSLLEGSADRVASPDAAVETGHARVDARADAPRADASADASAVESEDSPAADGAADAPTAPEAQPGITCEQRQTICNTCAGFACPDELAQCEGGIGGSCSVAWQAALACMCSADASAATCGGLLPDPSDAERGLRGCLFNSCRASCRL